MAKRVTTIPATLNLFDSKPKDDIARRKVCGYARVSTERDEQASSYEAQVDYYTRYIKSNPEWEFVGIYTDEGITATNTMHRSGFRQMVDDALDGKIDLIITKSCSRFARNTVDSLTTVRQLKEKGVEIYFEKENIWTLDAKGELLITIMSSLAQEESRSISENTTWGKRKAFADGKVSIAYSNFLGYDKGPNGEFVVNEEQAETVRLIYRLFLEGDSHYTIAKKLNEMGVKTPSGGGKWWTSTILSILQNEKYKGDALLQKGYIADFLTHKRKKNNGELQQYYVEGHHEPIVSADIYDRVQVEFERRKSRKGFRAGAFSAKIKCGDCGYWYGPKVDHSKSEKYRKLVYRCNKKYLGDHICKSPDVTLEQLKDGFVKAVNKMIRRKEKVIANTRHTMDKVCDISAIDAEQGELIAQMNALALNTKEDMGRNSNTALDQEEYEKRYAESSQKYKELKGKYESNVELIKWRKNQREIIRQFLEKFEAIDGTISEFDEELWCGLVDYVQANAKDDIRIVFKNGEEHLI